MASTISKLPSLEPFLNLITPTIRCQVDESGSASPHSDDSDYTSGSSSSDSDDDKDQSDLSSSHSGDDQEDSEVESESWTEELEAFPAKYRKPARLSKHIRIGRVSGERVSSLHIKIDYYIQVKQLCDRSLDDRLTLIRRPSGFGKTSLLSMMINVLDDVLVLYLNLDDLPADSVVFRAGLISCLNAALRSFLTRYRDLLGLTQHEINRRLYTGRRGSIFTWVMDLARRCGNRVVILLDNINAPLIKSTEDNIRDIRASLDILLVSPIEAAMDMGPSSEAFRTHVFDNITIDRSEWEVVNRCLGFTKSEISALAAERLPAEDVEPFVDDVIRTVDAFNPEFNLPSTYSMSGVLAQLRKRTGQPDSKPLLPLPLE
ncbi:hypothetical protein BDZ89DRAFT_1069439 [Hymenopellis radicata]|nr:hypothetical protein BDZ89DRAFT_1069439 [Hymenopellis radicata]